ncbi:MAG: ISKra4 family transposase [Chloroflexota bacterium]|nr:ISKra4 family transposase [Chloroflexota bacterium]
MNASTDVARLEELVTTMSERMATLTRTLGSWVQQAPHDLQELEQHVLRIVKELGATLVAGLTALLVPTQPPRTIPCPCGHLAAYQRLRPATVTTILGSLTLTRPYYLCGDCGHGQHPLDAQLGLCAGGRSTGLDELVALLGATQDSFAEAAAVLERLTLVHISPNSVLDATEALGATLVAHQAQAVAQSAAGHALPAAALPRPERLYITMDGVLAHLHERGWSELKVGCCYQTSSRPDRKRPEQLEIRAHSLSYVSALLEAERFGDHLWQEAARRGVMEAEEVVVVGDGAHWIWNIAQAQFPQATQVVDWYHASEYGWKAASALWGEREPQRADWAQRQLDRLWEGQVGQVLEALEQHQGAGEGVDEALSYYTTHQGRMDYAAYRARGLQIGSGSVESGCKQLVSARLKGAGMIWDAAGAEQVAVVRAWLKSGRWQEAMALRAVPGRGYERKAGVRKHEANGAGAGAEQERAAVSPAAVPAGRGLPAEALAQVRAEMAKERQQHPWRRPWSSQQQRAQYEEQGGHVRPAAAA